MNKTYSRIIWENYPSDKTPLNEQNLNKMDRSIDEIDNRVITLEETKATKAEVAPLIKEIEFNEANGVFTITRKNGSKFTIDTKMEKIAVNFDYNPTTQQIILTLIDGTKQYIDLSALITQYEFLDTDTVSFFIDTAGRVSAIVKEGSIEEKHLRPDYLAEIKVEAAKAQTSATNAAKSEANAKVSETNAKTSETNAGTSATTATQKATAAANSATAAKTSETNAKTSETNAATSKTAAATSAANASNSASTAGTKATEASNYATQSKSYAVGGTGTRTGENTDNAKYYYEKSKDIYENANPLPLATSSVRGGAKIGYTANGRNYPVQLSNEQMYVNVPWTDNNTTYGNMGAATADAAGKAGLVPAPPKGAQAKYLRGDGTWQTPPNTTYSVATASANGLLSAHDKTWIDGKFKRYIYGVDSNATNNYGYYKVASLNIGSTYKTSIIKLRISSDNFTNYAFIPVDYTLVVRSNSNTADAAITVIGYCDMMGTASTILNNLYVKYTNVAGTGGICEIYFNKTAAYQKITVDVLSELIRGSVASTSNYQSSGWVFSANSVISSAITGTGYAVYTFKGVISSTTIGSATKPIYLNKGVPTACSKAFDDYLPLSGGTVTGTVILSKTTDASGTADNSPALIVGTKTGQHIEIDPNEIMSKANGTTPGELFINGDGGKVTVGGGGLAVSGATTLNNTVRAANNGRMVSIQSSAPADTGMLWAY